MEIPPTGVLPPGRTIPSFTLPALEGGEASLPDGTAKGLTLTVFFKNTCPTCRLLVPFLQRLHEQVAPDGGRIVGVSQDGPEGAAGFAREMGLSLPVVVDGADWPVSRRYELVSVPTLYLFDRDGVIQRSGAGFNKKELQKMADELAASVGAGPPVLYREGESVPDLKPG